MNFDRKDIKNTFYLPGNLLFNLFRGMGAYEIDLWKIEERRSTIDSIIPKVISGQTRRYERFVKKYYHNNEDVESLMYETRLELKQIQPLRYYRKKEPEKLSVLGSIAFILSTVLLANKKTRLPYLYFNSCVFVSFLGQWSHPDDRN